MITDTMLREAATKSNVDYVNYLVQDYDPENQHVFSDRFEQKMQSVKRKARHPVFYQVRRWVASILLVLMIGGGVWMATDVEARAAVLGWIKDFYETYFVFRYDDESSGDDEPISYRPTWVPDGYTEFMFDDSRSRVIIAYNNEQGDILTLNYINNPANDNWFIDISENDVIDTLIGNVPADLFISNNPEVASGIAWTSNNTAFYINGFITQDDLITMAESVQKFNKK